MNTLISFASYPRRHQGSAPGQNIHAVLRDRRRSLGPEIGTGQPPGMNTWDNLDTWDTSDNWDTWDTCDTWDNDFEGQSLGFASPKLTARP